MIILPPITLVKHIQAREKHVPMHIKIVCIVKCIHTHIHTFFSDTMKYAWHIKLDMLMKYKLCRNNEKIRQTKPIELSDMLTKIDIQLIITNFLLRLDYRVRGLFWIHMNWFIYEYSEQKPGIEKFTAILGCINSHQYYSPINTGIWLLDLFYIFLVNHFYNYFFGT